MMNSLRLINEYGEDKFDSVMDVIFNESGRLELVYGKYALRQQLRKNILTRLRIDGFGTLIRDFLGKKMSKGIELQVRELVDVSIKEWMDNQYKNIDNVKNIDRNKIISEIKGIEVVYKSDFILIDVRIDTLGKESMNMLVEV